MEKHEIAVDAEFIDTVKTSSQAMLEAVALINIELRSIDRNCRHSDDAVLMAAMIQIRNIAGDLSAQWQELNLDLAARNLLTA